VFVITGGGSGIGRALALRLDALGEKVLIVGRREACLAKVVSEGSLIQSCCADITTQSGRQILVETIGNSSTLKALVHNAGLIEPIIALRELQESAWRSVMATNVDAPFLLTQALYTSLVGARVLHIGSGVAYFPVQGWAAYCISKAALAMLTRCWQLENPEISVTSVMPGIIDTDMQIAIRQSKQMDKSKQDYFIKLKNTHQLLRAEDVAKFLAHLLLEVSASDFVSKEWDIYMDSSHEFPNV